MRDHFTIGTIEIGKGARPLVIPEIGINHEGSLKVAKEMVDAAHRAGARVTDWLGNLTVWPIERNYMNDDYGVFVGKSL